MKKFGLTDKEAAESKQKYGDNSMTEQKSESFWDKLKSNLGDPMIKILIVALLVNVVLAILGITGVIKEGAPEWYEPIGIFIAIALATLVSTFSEYRNENAFQKLQEEASRIMCKAYRNGVIAEVAINDIVVGDAILLQAGDKIPADGILVDGDLKVDQSVLNGESREAKKIAVPDNWTDTDENLNFDNEYKVFRGSVVCSGNAVMEVTVVGDKSVYGKIASELQTEDDCETPLKLKLGKLAGGISKFGYIGGIAIAVAMLAKTLFMGDGGIEAFLFTGGVFQWAALLEAIIHSVMLAVIIIVMAVPEGLPLMIAIVSAQNMGKMLKDNVLVRKVAGIETAGSLNILFSDKTGTITKGKLEAVAFIDGHLNEYKTFSEISGELKNILSLSIHNNTLSLISGEGKDMKIIGGNATERAILGFGFAMGGGTEVAKEASDIVILDDNFNSIDRAILYGRTIFNSIRKFIVFQLTINVAAVLISFICPLIGLENPLSVIQILWVNLVMDTLAALAFGGEPALPRFMKEKPKRRTEPIISKNMMSQIITGAAWTFILSLVMLILGTFDADPAHPGMSFLESWGWVRESTGIIDEPHAYLHTAYFAFFIFIAVFNAFNARTDRLNLFDNLKQNKGFLAVFGIIAAVQVVMTYLGGAILSGYGLTIEWVMVLIMAISIIPVDLIRKAIANSASKKQSTL